MAAETTVAYGLEDIRQDEILRAIDSGKPHSDPGPVLSEWRAQRICLQQETDSEDIPLCIPEDDTDAVKTIKQAFRNLGASEAVMAKVFCGAQREGYTHASIRTITSQLCFGRETGEEIFLSFAPSEWRFAKVGQTIKHEMSDHVAKLTIINKHLPDGMQAITNSDGSPVLSFYTEVRIAARGDAYEVKAFSVKIRNPELERLLQRMANYCKQNQQPAGKAEGERLARLERDSVMAEKLIANNAKGA